MRKVHWWADNIISSLGRTSEENFQALLEGYSGIRQVNDPSLLPESFQASRVEDEHLFEDKEIPRFERLVIASVENALENLEVLPKDDRTAFFLSTTKGNIDLLDPDLEKRFGKERAYLFETAKRISDRLGFQRTPWVVSNACISGVLAINKASSMIREGRIDHAVVAGADILSAFTTSGFHSFMAMSEAPCKPFDKARDGLTIGEGCGTVVLSSEEKEGGIMVKDGVTRNDANHISGPSRTGEGLYLAVKGTLEMNRIPADAIDHINAHGTATDYNDEMESIAFSRVGLEEPPLVSIKGAVGHTLGAAGTIESIITARALSGSVIPPTIGFEELGVSKKVNVNKERTQKDLGVVLKTASGFGGCNAAMILKKEDR